VLQRLHSNHCLKNNKRKPVGRDTYSTRAVLFPQQGERVHQHCAQSVLPAELQRGDHCEEVSQRSQGQLQLLPELQQGRGDKKLTEPFKKFDLAQATDRWRSLLNEAEEGRASDQEKVA